MNQKRSDSLVLLHIEDDPGYAEMVCRKIELFDAPIKLFLAKDGVEGLDYIFRRGKYKDPEQSPRPTLVLLDLRMPKVDGLDVLKEIKSAEETADIPVVILTSSNAEKDVTTAYKYHANSYVVKPMDFSEFTELIELLCSYWMMSNHQNDTQK